MLAITLSGCAGGNKQDAASVNNSTTTTTTKETETAVKPTPMATPNATPANTATGEAPVELTYLGVSPDKQTASYKIKVKTTEAISQVDLGVKYLDANGKVLEETTYAWQNIVKSARQPIVNGQTYEVKDELPEGATKAEYMLKRVIFQNGSRWNAE